MLPGPTKVLPAEEKPVVALAPPASKTPVLASVTAEPKMTVGPVLVTVV